MRIVSLDNTEHYTWGDVCDGWHLAKTEKLSVIQERVPPGGCEIMHWHEHAEQFFYVLSGSATLTVRAEVFQLTAGQGIHIERGIAHQLKNLSPADVTFLVISCPPSHGDKFALGGRNDDRAAD